MPWEMLHDPNTGWLLIVANDGRDSLVSVLKPTPGHGWDHPIAMAWAVFAGGGTMRAEL